MSKTTKSAASGKPKWKPPNDDFPRSNDTPSNRLYKKIRGKRYEFRGTPATRRRRSTSICGNATTCRPGRAPRPVVEGVTVKDIANHFLKQAIKFLGTFADYLRTADRIVKQFDKGRVVIDLRPDDFAKFRRTRSKTRVRRAIGNEIQRTRTIFKWAPGKAPGRANSNT